MREFNENYDSQGDKLYFSIGDILEFIGSKCYPSPESTTSKSVGPSTVVLTSISRYGLHSHHVREIDSSGTRIKEWHGWVNPRELVSPIFMPYRIKIAVESVLDIRRGPSIEYPAIGKTNYKDSYTIIEEIKGWGKLHSRIGWIDLSFTERL